VINKKEKKVTLLNRGKFFKQYPIKTLPTAHANAKKSATPQPRLQGKVGRENRMGAEWLEGELQ
jgi:hypothetical protein